MGLYITTADVQVRLQGKVRFTEDPDDVNKMQLTLLDRLIAEAEGEVERDLSPRYFAPFSHMHHEQCDENNEPHESRHRERANSFKKIPERPTRNLLRTLCEIQAVIRVLETDFGSGSAMNGEAYATRLRERYNKIIDKELERKSGKQDDASGWRYPPLPGLKLNYFNRKADDGYAGMVLNTTQGIGGFPATQINDPSENFTNGVWDELDHGNPGVFGRRW